MTAARQHADLPRPSPGDDDTRCRRHIRLLDGLTLGDGHQRITRLPRRAVTALLARLALAPDRAHAREELVELLWPGACRPIVFVSCERATAGWPMAWTMT